MSRFCKTIFFLSLLSFCACGELNTDPGVMVSVLSEDGVSQAIYPYNKILTNWVPGEYYFNRVSEDFVAFPDKGELRISNDVSLHIKMMPKVQPEKTYSVLLRIDEHFYTNDGDGSVLEAKDIPVSIIFGIFTSTTAEHADFEATATISGKTNSLNSGSLKAVVTMPDDKILTFECSDLTITRVYAD